MARSKGRSTITIMEVQGDTIIKDMEEQMGMKTSIKMRLILNTHIMDLLMQETIPLPSMKKTKRSTMKFCLKDRTLLMHNTSRSWKYLTKIHKM